MRVLSLRLIVSMILGMTLVSLLSSFYEVHVQETNLRRDLERRAEELGGSLAGSAEHGLEANSPRSLQVLVQRLGSREDLAGIAVYNAQGSETAITPALAQWLNPKPAAVNQAFAEDKSQSVFLQLGDRWVHVYAEPLHSDEDPALVSGALLIVHDAGYIRAQSRMFWRKIFLRVLAEVFVIVLITLVILRWSVQGPIARVAQWMKAMRTGKAAPHPVAPGDIALLRPLASEVANFADNLNRARCAAETEARLRDASESQWTAHRLAAHVRTRLGNGRLFVISNREPYIHQRKGKAVEVMVPASGLVTALEPVLCACDGTWIAHGSGSADRDTVDSNDRLRVPPDEPRYTLRRVWLGKEEEEGYYYGFANEGLWPLCHIAHTRPLFRASDWAHYRAVNQKFADAALREMADTEQPLVLVQDYHFGLLPRLIKERRPEARIAIFWHIPWPNPEAFGICPWQRALLDGLLGADLIGFHVQAHCNNFLQSVDRALESRINWEKFTVKCREHRTMVRPFPISVDAADEEPAPSRDSFGSPVRNALLKDLGVDALFLGVGVDRVDYTKGIIERFLAIERLLEKYPVYLGQFTFVQIGAPSRTHIKRYHDLLAAVEEEAERINWRFQTASWKPIVFLKRQHNHAEIQRYYRAADLCMVTSLHDGMNLVAKEFLAARQDEQGVLILSRFTGAARELRDALLVNPYDIDQTAEAIRSALQMDPEDARKRVQHMRRVLKEANVYRWAGNLISTLCEVRIESPEPREEGVQMGDSAA